MRVILYNSGLGPKVASGEKTTTIRQRARCRPGDVLSHREWTGLPYRSKQRELCRTICLEVKRVIISTGSVNLSDIDSPVHSQVLLFSHLADQVARDDGFKDFTAMRAWFAKTHGLPFRGEMIRW